MLWNVELDVLKKVYFPLQIMLLKRQPKYPALKKKIKQKAGHLWRTSDSMSGAGSIKMIQSILLCQKIKFARKGKNVCSFLTPHSAT